MVTYKVELTEKELKSLARDRAVTGRYWRFLFLLLFPLVIPVIGTITFRDWLKVLSEPVQWVFLGLMLLPWVIVVILLNRTINRKTQACFDELKKQVE